MRMHVRCALAFHDVPVYLQLKRKELSQLESQVTEESKALTEVEASAMAMQHSINSTLYDKQRGLERLASIQVRAVVFHTLTSICW